MIPFMKPLFPKFLILLSSLSLLLAVTSVFAGEGNERNGSDSIQTYAWFLGTEPIRYCAVMDPNFGASLPVAMNEILTAFKTWEDYITKKRVNQSTDTRRPVIDAKATPMSTCDGTEDLKFYFGVQNAEVSAEKAKYINPLAFVKELHRDESAGWAKGYIWIASKNEVDHSTFRPFPEWSNSRLLRGTLLHEIGHTLGMGHLPGTIMDANFSSNLRGATHGHAADWVTRIDHSAELYDCEDCSLKGLISDDQTEAKRVFKLFTGRDANGTPTAIYSLNPNHTNPATPTLFLKDQVGTVALPLSMAKVPGTHDNIYSGLEIWESVFSAYRKLPYDPATGTEGATRGRHFEINVSYATIKDSKGNTYDCIMEDNLGVREATPMRIRYFENHVVKTLMILPAFDGTKRAENNASKVAH